MVDTNNCTIVLLLRFFFFWCKNLEFAHFIVYLWRQVNKFSLKWISWACSTFWFISLLFYSVFCISSYLICCPHFALSMFIHILVLLYFLPLNALSPHRTLQHSTRTRSNQNFLSFLDCTIFLYVQSTFKLRLLLCKKFIKIYWIIVVSKRRGKKLRVLAEKRQIRDMLG